MKSCLIILYRNKENDIYKSLYLLRKRKILDIAPSEFNYLKFEESNVEIIKSDKAGVGKSTQIKLEIKNANKEYIHFPFWGVFSREDVIERLKNLEI